MPYHLRTVDPACIFTHTLILDVLARILPPETINAMLAQTPYDMSESGGPSRTGHLGMRCVVSKLRQYTITNVQHHEKLSWAVGLYQRSTHTWRAPMLI
jgi:hypothetical protein